MLSVVWGSLHLTFLVTSPLGIAALSSPGGSGGTSFLIKIYADVKPNVVVMKSGILEVKTAPEMVSFADTLQFSVDARRTSDVGRSA